MNPWSLPSEATFGDKSYRIRADFRDILEIIRHLNDASQPEFVRWKIALALFYEDPIPPEHTREALAFFSDFLSYGCHSPTNAPKLLDWEQDAQVIIADVNKAAGTESRALPLLQWWTFLSWFHAIGEGQLSTLISIREKLRSGKKLEKWEQDYYRKNRNLVTLRRQYTPEELAEQEKLKKLLDT
jgi:hypothetical protein